MQPHQISITNEKGHLSGAEIDHMVQRAEQFCAESESNKAKIEAENCSENYFHYAQHWERGVLRDNSKVATDRRSRLQCRSGYH